MLREAVRSVQKSGLVRLVSFFEIGYLCHRVPEIGCPNSRLSIDFASYFLSAIAFPAFENERLASGLCPREPIA